MKYLLTIWIAAVEILGILAIASIIYKRSTAGMYQALIGSNAVLLAALVGGSFLFLFCLTYWFASKAQNQ